MSARGVAANCVSDVCATYAHVHSSLSHRPVLESSNYSGEQHAKRASHARYARPVADISSPPRYGACTYRSHYKANVQSHTTRPPTALSTSPTDSAHHISHGLHRAGNQASMRRRTQQRQTCGAITARHRLRVRLCLGLHLSARAVVSRKRRGRPLRGRRPAGEAARTAAARKAAEGRRSAEACGAKGCMGS